MPPAKIHTQLKEMSPPTGNKFCTDEEFIALFKKHGPTETAKRLGGAIRGVYERRRRIEERHGIRLSQGKIDFTNAEYPKVLDREIENGLVFVGSDAHFWPGEKSTAFRGFCLLSKRMKPTLICLNGDVMDGASISRHPPIGWEEAPTLIEEITVCRDRVDEIRLTAPQAEHIWTIGNHDARFESKLAMQAPQYAKVHGCKLSDHFPGWRFTWALALNSDVMVKHRFKGGIHATHNNAMWSGKTMVTGHLHSLKVTPFSDYNGTRFGVDTGTLERPDAAHADYTEQNPLNHRSGFIILTFLDGLLLWPEIVSVLDEKHIQFRGEVIAV